MGDDAPKTTTRSFRALVLEKDPDFTFEANHPVVYDFPGRTGQKRDKGADSQIYKQDS